MTWVRPTRHRWVIVSINKWNFEQTRVLLLSNRAFYRVKFDFEGPVVTAIDQYVASLAVGEGRNDEKREKGREGIVHCHAYKRFGSVLQERRWRI